MVPLILRAFISFVFSLLATADEGTVSIKHPRSSRRLKKTNKAKLLHKLQELPDNEKPFGTYILIVDTMFFLHTLQNPPNTYGKIAEEILQRL